MNWCNFIYSALQKYSPPWTFRHIIRFKHKDIKFKIFVKKQQVGHNRRVEQNLLNNLNFFNK